MTAGQALGMIVGFWLFMITVTLLLARRGGSESRSGFLAADRKVPLLFGATSIAASWIWAPALFVSVQKTFELGLGGALWFTVPNIAALAIFAWVGPRIRDAMPGGFTLPEWILHRLGSAKLHRLYLVPLVWYQIMAVTVQIFVGGLMLNFLTGLPLSLVMGVMLTMSLSYALISGLRASIVTDFVQLAFIMVGLAVVIPMLVGAVGLEGISAGLGGEIGTLNILDPRIAVSFGIVTAIGLLAGALSDQQYWQRSLAISRAQLERSFLLGAALFGLVPIALSLLGFVAANPALGVVAPEGMQLPMIGVAAIAHLLPQWVAVFFVLMLLAGLTSTLDSGLCAGAALYAVDFGKLSEAERAALAQERVGATLTEAEAQILARVDARLTSRARVGMALTAGAGLAVALLVQNVFPLDRLWWLFNGLASCFVVPTVLSAVWPRLTARGAFWGIVGGLVGMIGFIYGNWVTDDNWTVGSAVFIIVIGFISAWVFRSESTREKEGIRVGP